MPSTKLVKLPIALYNSASELAEQRGLTIGAALELLVSRGENFQTRAPLSPVQPKALKPLTRLLPRQFVASPTRSMQV